MAITDRSWILSFVLRGVSLGLAWIALTATVTFALLPTPTPTQGCGPVCDNRPCGEFTCPGENGLPQPRFCDVVTLNGCECSPIECPTAPATPTPSCAATGTPYCADQCSPCPTIRENCPAVDCGYCIQNPTCADGEVCDPRGGGPPSNCCDCVTPTPHGTNGPPPTPSPTSVTPSPTPTPPQAPLPTCDATVTPYCASQCPHYPGDCGNCIQNPTCEDGEVCEPRVGGPPYDCCHCVTPTPRGTNGPSPTPSPTSGIAISGLVYDGSIGVDAPLAGAEVAYAYDGGGGSVHTDAAGRYRFELPSEVTEFELFVAADGFFFSRTGYAVADLGPSLDIGLYPDGCASASAITIVPDIGPVGTAVDVSGQCYFIHSGREGMIYFDLEPVATVRGETGGEYQTTFTVPATASEGPHLVSLRAGNSQFGVVTFNVVLLPFCIGDCACPGDCDGDGSVHVDELIRMVNIALNGDTDTVACPQIAQWCPLEVDISCLIEAVNHALQGCPRAGA